jgi:hypothetical protein
MAPSTSTNAGTRIDVLSIQAFVREEAVKQGCEQLLAACYTVPETPLRYAIDHEATHVYVAYGDDGLRPAGYFFARSPEQIIPSIPPTAYMGLTIAIRQPGLRVAARLWTAFLRDARRAVPDAEVLVWYRTASPFCLHPARVLLRDGCPSPDGTINMNRTVLSHLRDIRQAHGIPDNDANRHPCVVRRYAHARYNDSENAIIAAHRRKHGRDVLDSLNIREDQGDRLLMLGYLP